MCSLRSLTLSDSNVYGLPGPWHEAPSQHLGQEPLDPFGTTKSDGVARRRPSHLSSVDWSKIVPVDGLVLCWVVES
jgi:hypothetical protein